VQLVRPANEQIVTINNAILRKCNNAFVIISITKQKPNTDGTDRQVQVDF